jgi:hypothetical protein
MLYSFRFFDIDRATLDSRLCLVRQTRKSFDPSEQLDHTACLSGEVGHFFFG